MKKPAGWFVMISVMLFFSSCVLGLVAVHKKFPYICFYRQCRLYQRDLSWHWIAKISKRKKHKDSNVSQRNKNNLKKNVGKENVTTTHENKKKKKLNNATKGVFSDSAKTNILTAKAVKKDTIIPTINSCLISDSLPITTFKENSIVINFPFDNDRITDKDQIKLKEYFNSIDLKKVKSVVIIGFTDSIGNSDYNKNLSSRRARNVYDYLKSSVIPVLELSTQNIEQISIFQLF